MIHALVLGWILAVIPPTPTDYVTDNAQALSAATKDRLETELHDFDAKTGDQILVWIGQSTNGESLENFTVNAAQKWKAGRKGKDNGAVLFLFMRDRKVRIEVGYGLESVLTDAQSADIISKIVTPRMRDGDTDGAVTGAVDHMLTIVDPTFVLPSSEPTSGSSGDGSGSDDTMAAIVMVLIFVVVVGGLIFAAILTFVRRGKRHGDWLDSFMFVNPPGSGGGFLGGGGGFSGGGGGFSGGGGGFGGGGASGGW